MDEEKAVLDFFAKPENLPLALSVAQQVDTLREKMNSNFWGEFQKRMDASLGIPGWKTETIADRDFPKMLTGIRFRPTEPRPNYLFPMLEQQHMGGKWRIFMGLMWQESPTPAELSIPEVLELKKTLEAKGYRGNRNFIAWRWTDLYPRQRDFLLGMTLQPESLFSKVESVFNAHELLELISGANTALLG